MNAYNIKYNIKSNFNRSYETYDDNCYVQIQAARSLISKLKKYNVNYNCVIDLGCGTGITTEILANTIQYNQFQCVDFASRLLEIARRRLSNYNIDAIELDFDEIDYQPKHYDLVFSNMSLQWSKDLTIVIKQIYNHLVKNGIFAFSLPLHGTFHELNQIHVNRLPIYHPVLQILINTGFTIIQCENETIINTFNSVKSAIQSIKLIGANGLSPSRNQTLRGKSMMNTFFKNPHPPYSLTYQLGYFLCRAI